MKTLHAAILILAVLVGQAHACKAYFITANGQRCDTCVELPCAFDSLESCQTAKVASVDTASSDCHACCSLKSCDDKSGHAEKSAVFHPVPDMLLSTLVVQVVAFPELPLPRISILAADQYANPPPGRQSSRAPPFQLS